MAKTPEKIEFQIFGQTGLNRTDGHVHEEWHVQLRGARGAKMYREMQDNNAVIGGLLFAFENLIRQVPFQVNPSGDTERHIEEAKFIESALFDDMTITWPDLLSEILTMLPMGWSYFEVINKFRQGDNPDGAKRSRFKDGRIGWRKISIRGQETLDSWEFDTDGSIKGMWQLSPPDYNRVFIPIEKALLFRTKSNKNNPEGRSLLRNAFRSWKYLKRLQDIEAIGAERDLVGLPVMSVPPRIMNPSAGPDDKKIRLELEKLIQQIRRDEREGVLMPAEQDEEGNPTGFKLELLTSGGSRQIDLNKSIVRYEQRILTSVLAQFLLLGQDKSGSFALASTQTNLFGYALNSLVDSITEVFNRFAIPRLYQVNGVPQEFWGKLVHGDIEKPELQDLALYASTLTKVGIIVPDEKLEIAMRELGGLPMPDRKENPVLEIPETTEDTALEIPETTEEEE